MAGKFCTDLCSIRKNQDANDEVSGVAELDIQSGTKEKEKNRCI